MGYTDNMDELLNTRNAVVTDENSTEGDDDEGTLNNLNGRRLQFIVWLTPREYSSYGR